MWIQKYYNGGWSGTRQRVESREFCQVGGVLNFTFQPKLQVGAELFYKTADARGTKAPTSLGVGSRYHLNVRLRQDLLSLSGRRLYTYDRRPNPAPSSPRCAYRRAGAEKALVRSSDRFRPSNNRW